MVNEHEARARIRKMELILSKVPAGETADQVARTAEWLAALPQADRDVLAAAAGVNPPSDETWSLVVAAQKARRPTSSNPFARCQEVR